MLFNNDKTILWYLDTPSRLKNKEIYTDFFKNCVTIPTFIVDKIKSQQESLHEDRRFNRVTQGYLIANDITENATFKKLNEIVFRVINQYKTEEELAVSVLEGIAREYTALHMSRSKKYIEPAKKRDDYRCQTCGLQLSIDGKHILQVHHINPLRGKVVTNLDNLISLCPTCHYIAHRKVPPYTPEEIRRLLGK